MTNNSVNTTNSIISSGLIQQQTASTSSDINNNANLIELNQDEEEIVLEYDRYFYFNVYYMFHVNYTQTSINLTGLLLPSFFLCILRYTK
jgi:hypothetical protein